LTSVEKTNNMEGFEGTGELSEVERIVLKMRQDIY
jgi:hypothetical protein